MGSQQAETLVTWSDGRVAEQRPVVVSGGSNNSEETMATRRIGVTSAALGRPVPLTLEAVSAPTVTSEMTHPSIPYINPAPTHHILAFPQEPQTEEQRALALAHVRQHFQFNQAVLNRQNIDQLARTIREMVRNDPRALLRPSWELVDMVRSTPAGVLLRGDVILAAVLTARSLTAMSAPPVSQSPSATERATVQLAPPDIIMTISHSRSPSPLPPPAPPLPPVSGASGQEMEQEEVPTWLQPLQSRWEGGVADSRVVIPPHTRNEAWNMDCQSCVVLDPEVLLGEAVDTDEEKQEKLKKQEKQKIQKEQEEEEKSAEVSVISLSSSAESPSSQLVLEQSRSPLRPLESNEDWQREIFKSYATGERKPPSTPSSRGSDVRRVLWGPDSPEDLLEAEEGYPKFRGEDGILISEESEEYQQRLQQWISYRSERQVIDVPSRRVSGDVCGVILRPIDRPVGCWDEQGQYFERPVTMEEDVPILDSDEESSEEEEEPKWLQRHRNRPFNHNFQSHKVVKFPPCEQLFQRRARRAKGRRSRWQKCARNLRSRTAGRPSRLSVASTPRRVSAAVTGARRLSSNATAVKRKRMSRDDAAPAVRRRVETTKSQTGSIPVVQGKQSVTLVSASTAAQTTTSEEKSSRPNQRRTVTRGVTVGPEVQSSPVVSAAAAVRSTNKEEKSSRPNQQRTVTQGVTVGPEVQSSPVVVAATAAHATNTNKEEKSSRPNQRRTVTGNVTVGPEVQSSPVVVAATAAHATNTNKEEKSSRPNQRRTVTGGVTVGPEVQSSPNEPAAAAACSANFDLSDSDLDLLESPDCEILDIVDLDTEED